MAADNPVGHIISVTKSLVRTMAAQRVFVAYEGEAIRQVVPEAVRVWRVVDGSNLHRAPERGLQSINMPGILITYVQSNTQPDGGLNCADDEAVRVIIQIVDSAAHQHENVQTYSIWKNLIRKELLKTPHPFLANTDPEIFDPFTVTILSQAPADAQALIRNEQQVELLVFQVMVRHHR